MGRFRAAMYSGYQGGGATGLREREPVRYADEASVDYSDLADKHLGTPHGSGASSRRASVRDTAEIAVRALLPTVAGGVIKRRPRLLGIAQRLQLDAPSVALFQRLRRRYGLGPLRLRIPGRSFAVVLAGADAARLLADSPEPFTPATVEKRAALRHFQPHGVLISTGGMREARRRLNESVLETTRSMHEISDSAVAAVSEEMDRLLTSVAAGTRPLDWGTFEQAWWRLVRRVVLGDSARDDDEVTALLDELRSDANWAYLHRDRRELRQRLDTRLRSYVHGAEPGSLARLLAAAPSAAGSDPVGQVPHWLFAFDAAGMAAFRTLALLATHPKQAARARAEADDADSPFTVVGGAAMRPQLLPYLRACLLDTVRLWPTTPALLRESNTETKWGVTKLPTGTEFLIFTPFLHRDTETLSYADIFDPDIWLDGRARNNPAPLPFSAGPGECPGRNVVLLMVSTVLAQLLRRGNYELVSAPVLSPCKPLPATIDNFGLRFRMRAR